MDRIGRFAPSPTGRMHLGNVMCALLSWLDAKAGGGMWRLRIEDIDSQRCKREYALQIMDDLTWLGLEWDGEVVWQSQRGDIYEHYLRMLEEKGLTYFCGCSRADLLSSSAPHEADGRVVYAGTCRNKGLKEGAVRVRVPEGLQRHCGDFIVRRKDGAWAYQLAVVVDDGLMGVTDVVRGRDLLSSVPQQRFLFDLFGMECPFFHHIPLLCNAEGQRLCKRDRGLDMAVLRESFSAEEIIGRLGYLCGLTPEYMPMSANKLLPLFDWGLIRDESILIDDDKSQALSL